MHFNVTTPWGPYQFGLREEKTLAILNRLLDGTLNGERRADEVFDRLRETLGPIPDSDLIRLFAQFRRWRLISFRESPVTT